MAQSADLTRVAIVKKQGTPPAVPSDPAFDVCRITGESMAFTPDTVTSAELDASGNIRDQVLTGATASGDLSFEFADHMALNQYLSAVFGNNWAFVDQGGTPYDFYRLINGTDLSLFMLEKTFPSESGSIYHRFDDTAFSAFSFSVTPGSIVTGTATTIGGEMEQTTDAITGATYPDPGTAPAYRPHNVVITIGTIGSAVCMGTFTATFDNGMRGIQCIGTLGDAEKIRGRFNASGSAQVYFGDDSSVLVDDLINQTDISITAELQDAEGNPEYIFEFPRCKVTNASVNAGSTDSDLVIELSFQGLYSSNDLYTCVVKRPTTDPAP